MSDAKKHFVVMPFPAFGHITPLLELSKKLVQHQHTVTFAVSEYKVAEIKRRNLLSPEEEKSIRLLGLVDGLSEDYDQNISPKQLSDAVERMGPAQREFLEQMPVKGEHGGQTASVDAVIADLCFSIPVPLAKERGIPGYTFSCAAAWSVVGTLTINEDTPTCPDQDHFEADTSEEDVGIKRIPVSMKRWLVDCNASMAQSTAIVINSFEDLEPDTKTQMAYLAPTVAHIPLQFVGPLFPSQNESAGQTSLSQQVAHWLDEQKDRSVVYVSFGSMAVPVPQQITEIAKALLDLKRPFIWSLRTTQHHNLPAEIRDSVATQFASADVPYLILNWAPQKAILEHRATGVFVSHCGWNSTLEGISGGVPIVAWPMFADQPMNGALVAKIGVGVMLPDVAVSGSQRIVASTELAEALTTVAGWDGKEEGKAFYKTVQELSRKAKEAVGPGGKSTKDFESLMKL